MSRSSLLILSLFLLTLALGVNSKSVLENAQEYLDKAEKEFKVQLKLLIDAQWDQGSNITQENEKKLVSVVKC